MNTEIYSLRVNGADHPVVDAWLGESLLYVLRERLGLPGAKAGCEQGECGSCSVMVDGTLVCACLDWQADGLREPASVSQATNAYHADADPLRDFIAEKCVEGADAWVLTDSLYNGYVTHAEAAHERPMNLKRFTQALAKRPGLTPCRTNQGRGWQGIGLSDLFQGGA